jgi:hypothetical protein
MGHLAYLFDVLVLVVEQVIANVTIVPRYNRTQSPLHLLYMGSRILHIYLYTIVMKLNFIVYPFSFYSVPLEYIDEIHTFFRMLKLHDCINEKRTS